jgi:hypothetical protein
MDEFRMYGLSWMDELDVNKWVGDTTLVLWGIRFAFIR